jgi:HSP20 family molecular chaperone IbpA
MDRIFSFLKKYAIFFLVVQLAVISSGLFGYFIHISNRYEQQDVLPYKNAFRVFVDHSATKENTLDILRDIASHIEKSTEYIPVFSGISNVFSSSDIMSYSEDEFLWLYSLFENTKNYEVLLHDEIIEFPVIENKKNLSEGRKEPELNEGQIQGMQTYHFSHEKTDINPVITSSGTREITVILKNDGESEWKQEEVFLMTANPYRHNSIFYVDEQWIGKSVIAKLSENVVPGSFGSFSFVINIPEDEGVYNDFFYTLGLKRKDTWFAFPNQIFEIPVYVGENKENEIVSTSSLFTIPEKRILPSENTFTNTQKKLSILYVFTEDYTENVYNDLQKSISKIQKENVSLSLYYPKNISEDSLKENMFIMILGIIWVLYLAWMLYLYMYKKKLFSFLLKYKKIILKVFSVSIMLAFIAQAMCLFVYEDKDSMEKTKYFESLFHTENTPLIIHDIKQEQESLLFQEMAKKPYVGHIDSFLGQKEKSNEKITLLIKDIQKKSDISLEKIDVGVDALIQKYNEQMNICKEYKNILKNNTPKHFISLCQIYTERLNFIDNFDKEEFEINIKNVMKKMLFVIQNYFQNSEKTSQHDKQKMFKSYTDDVYIYPNHLVGKVIPKSQFFSDGMKFSNNITYLINTPLLLLFPVYVLLLFFIANLLYFYFFSFFLLIGLGWNFQFLQKFQKKYPSLAINSNYASSEVKIGQNTMHQSNKIKQKSSLSDMFKDFLSKKQLFQKKSKVQNVEKKKLESKKLSNDFFISLKKRVKTVFSKTEQESSSHIDIMKEQKVSLYDPEKKPSHLVPLHVSETVRLIKIEMQVGKYVQLEDIEVYMSDKTLHIFFFDKKKKEQFERHIDIQEKVDNKKIKVSIEEGELIISIPRIGKKVQITDGKEDKDKSKGEKDKDKNEGKSKSKEKIEDEEKSNEGKNNEKEKMSIVDIVAKTHDNVLERDVTTHITEEKDYIIVDILLEGIKAENLDIRISESMIFVRSKNTTVVKCKKDIGLRIPIRVDNVISKVMKNAVKLKLEKKKV